MVRFVSVLVFVVGFAFQPYLIAEDLNRPRACLLLASEETLTEEIAELPGREPLMIAPLVKPPESGKVSTEMKKLALKYDVTKIGERKVGSGLNFYPVAKEVELGRELSQELDLSVRMVRDPVITEYVNRVGQNLVRNSDAKVPFTIKIVDDPTVNAAALPGGFFYLNTGLILAADNEAELAAVMSHEIAHVAARHATHNLSRQNLMNLCMLPAMFVAGPAGLALHEAAGLATPLGLMKFSRDAEREADLLGMQYAYAAGYDPAAMVSFFEKVEAQEKKKKGFLARAFDTHPMTAERVKRAQEEMASMLPAKNDYIVTTSEFDDVKARLSALANHHAMADTADKRPTLRKGARDSEDESKEGGRPTLKRGGEQ